MIWLQALRKNVHDFLFTSLSKQELINPIVEVGPMDKDEGGLPEFYFDIRSFVEGKGFTYKSLDRNSQRNPDYVMDLENCKFEDNSVGTWIICEILEHTENPRQAIAHIHRTLKPGGLVLFSTPFDLGVHAPYPDFWRFTHYGLKSLFKDFSSVEITVLKNEQRQLMPIHYTGIARK